MNPVWLGFSIFPEGFPQWAVAIVALMFVFLFIVVPSLLVMTHVERKLTADLQARIGPNRAGPWGIGQTVADFLKLLQKRANPGTAKRDPFWAALRTMALYSTVAVLPLGSASLLVDTDVSVFVPFWAALVVALGTLTMGFRQRSVLSQTGGLRTAAFGISGALPALLAILCAGLRSGSFKWKVIAGSQGFFPYSWAVINPFQLVAFLVFVISGLVIFGISPADAATGSVEISGGVSNNAYGRALGLFRFGSIYSFWLWSLMATVLFLGGWNLPPALAESLRAADTWDVTDLLELIVLLTKTFVLMAGIIWLSRANPRLRTDHVTGLVWRILTPAALIALLGAAGIAAWSAG